MNDKIKRLQERIKKLENIEHFATKTIEKQEKEIEKQQYILMGVMHSVDKWLDGDELKQDEVNRAATMREKTLQITEKQEKEIEKLNVELVGMRGACESYKMHYDKAQTEIERLREENKNQKLVIEEIEDTINPLPFETDFEKAIRIAKSESIKEFAERVKKKVNLDLCEAINCSDYLYDLPKLIDNLVKEMTEVSE